MNDGPKGEIQVRAEGDVNPTKGGRITSFQMREGERGTSGGRDRPFSKSLQTAERDETGPTSGRTKITILSGSPGISSNRKSML